MASRKIWGRKIRPSPPYWFMLGVDGCWWCKNRNGCTSCGITKDLPRRRDLRNDERAKEEYSDDTY